MIHQRSLFQTLLALSALLCGHLPAATPNIASPNRTEDLLFLDNGSVKIGINRAMGASITWLSWTAFPHNIVNSADPGRLIQQSYYAGRLLDRRAEGQSPSWSPWAWNPIQGVAIFSRAATQPRNFGPHGAGNSLDSAAGPCIHIAPIDRVPMGPQSTYRYRYWLIVGTAEEIAARLDVLWEKYSGESAQLTLP